MAEVTWKAPNTFFRGFGTDGLKTYEQWTLLRPVLYIKAKIAKSRWRLLKRIVNSICPWNIHFCDNVIHCFTKKTWCKITMQQLLCCTIFVCRRFVDIIAELTVMCGWFMTEINCLSMVFLCVYQREEMCLCFRRWC